MLDAERLKKYIGKDNYEEIKPMVEECDPAVINKVPMKNPTVAVVLSILLGFIGIDRLYQGGIKMMLVKLASVVLTLGTWYIADIYYTQFAVLQDNKAKIVNTITA